MNQHVSPRAACEQLEGRRLLTSVLIADLPPDPITVAADEEDLEVILIGTDEAELIEFAAESADARSTAIERLEVFIDGALRVRITVDENLQSLGVRGEGGDDTIILGRNVPVKARLDGGAGNDLVGGSRMGDVVTGGDGNDTLDGGTGGDLVEGGAGDDTLVPGRLGAFGGVVIDSGQLEGEGLVFVPEEGDPVNVTDNLPFDASAVYVFPTQSGSARFANTTFTGADFAFGGPGSDEVLGHGRTFFGGEVETIMLDRQGALPAPETQEFHAEVQLRAAGDDTTFDTTFEAAAVTLSAIASETADAASYGEAFDEQVEGIGAAAGIWDLNVSVEPGANGSVGRLFSRTLVVPAAELTSDTLTIADARDETLGYLGFFFISSEFDYDEDGAITITF